MRHLTSQQLTATADEQLTGVSLEVVRRHLGLCPECRAHLGRFEHQREALREVLGAFPEEAYWDELLERIETRLHTIDVRHARLGRAKPARGEPKRDGFIERVVPTPEVAPARSAVRPEPVLHAELIPPTAKARVATGSAPALRVITVSTPSDQVAPAEPEHRPLPRGLVMGASVVALLLAAFTLAVVYAPVPRSMSDMRVSSWLPRAMSSLSTVAHAVAAPVIALARQTPRRPAEPDATTAPEAPSAKAWHPESAAPESLALLAPRRIPPVHATAPADMPVTLASPALPRRVPTNVRQTPRPLPQAVLPARAPSRAPAPERASAAVPVQAPVGTPPSPTIRPVVSKPPVTAPAPTIKPVVVATPPERHAAPAPDEGAAWPLFCGEVLDQTGAPVTGARVQLADLDLVAKTDRRGRFCLAMPPGDRTLTISALGFASWRQLVDVSAGTTEVQVTLKDAP